MIELQTMITLIEGEYPHHERNTPGKMVKLIKKEFDKVITENDILQFYNLSFEDWESETRFIEHDFRFETYQEARAHY